MALSFKDSINAINDTESVAAAEAVSVANSLQEESDAVATDSHDESWVRSESYDYYDRYKPTYKFTIDADKVINTSKKKITITKESNARFLSFTMPRYSDGQDLLSLPYIQFYYVNAAGASGRAVAVNVEYTDELIRFAWLQDSSVTATPGKLAFEVQVIGVVDNEVTYMWRSRTCDVLYVAECLQSDEEIISSNDWTDSFLAKVGEKITEVNKIANNAKGVLQDAVVAVADANDKIAKMYLAIDETKKELNDSVRVTISSMIDDALGNYYDSTGVYSKTEVDAAIADINLDGKLAEVKTAIARIDENVAGLSKNQVEINSANEAIDDFISMMNDEYAKNNDFKVIKDMVTKNAEQVEKLNNQLESLGAAIASIKEAMNTTYSILSSDDGEYKLTLYKQDDNGKLPETTFIVGKIITPTLDLEACAVDGSTYIKATACSAEAIKDALDEADSVWMCNIKDIDWTLTDVAVLEELYDISDSEITGTVYVPMISQSQLCKYSKAWPNLEMRYDTIIEQNPVTFVNWDDTVLNVQYVAKGMYAVDPIISGTIVSPVREPDEKYQYVFNGWDIGFDAVNEPLVVHAVYKKSQRKYTVRYVSKGIVKQESTAKYGDTVSYTGALPTYTIEEGDGVYYLFDHWDKSPFVDGDKTINAVYTCCHRDKDWPTNKSLQEMTPVEVYAVTQARADLSTLGVRVGDEINIPLGYDVEYADVESTTIISSKTTFTGTNYFDTGIKLLDEDRAFVLAIELELDKNTSPDSTLVYYPGVAISAYDGCLTWNHMRLDMGAIEAGRTVVVLRHKRGQHGVTVYRSTSTEPLVDVISSRSFTDKNGTLVFGCRMDGQNICDGYAKATVYWSKLWYGDLGDDECKRIAYCTHENLEMIVAGFNDYRLTNQPTRCAMMTLLSGTPLSRPVQYTDNQDSVASWDTSSLNKYLNEKIYRALSTQMQQIVKSVLVENSECRLFVPSVIEMSNNQTCGEDDIDTIPYMVNDMSRMVYDDNGQKVSYWLRTTSSGLVNVVTKDGKISTGLPCNKASTLVELCV